MLKKAILILFVVLAALQLQAQDSVFVERDTGVKTIDTLAIKSYAKRYSPRKAILYAAVLPGWGQAYNKKYWKLPLVYGGFYFIGYYVKEYNDLYTEYKGYLFENIEAGVGENSYNPNENVRLTTAQLRNVVDDTRRERDLMIIFFGGMYLLQMVDAHVDAHLKEFDLNPKLQVSIEPSLQQDAWTGRTTGVSLVFRF